MSHDVIVHGATKEEAEQKAKEAIAHAHPYEQPFSYSPTQQPDGSWAVRVHFRGLD